MTSNLELRVSGYIPRRFHAKRLWADGLYSRAQLEALDGYDDLEDAWSRCDAPELLLPLAYARGADRTLVVLVASGWLSEAFARLFPLEWPRVDVELARAIRAEALAPDVDPGALHELRARAIQRAGSAAKGATGRHRYRLLSAVSGLASLGIRRVWESVGTSGDAEFFAEHVCGAVDDAAAATVADLFASRPDAADFRAWAVREAREAFA